MPIVHGCSAASSAPNKASRVLVIDCSPNAKWQLHSHATHRNRQERVSAPEHGFLISLEGIVSVRVWPVMLSGFLPWLAARQTSHVKSSVVATFQSGHISLSPTLNVPPLWQWNIPEVSIRNTAPVEPLIRRGQIGQHWRECTCNTIKHSGLTCSVLPRITVNRGIHLQLLEAWLCRVTFFSCMWWCSYAVVRSGPDSR